MPPPLLQRFAHAVSRRLECYTTVRGADGSPYLSRYWIAGDRKHGGWRLYLNRFHRSDEGTPGVPLAHHDHPFDAIALVIANGYRESRLLPDLRREVRDLRPGSINVIGATTCHRVELFAPELEAYTLCVTLPVGRAWGFYDLTGGYMPFKRVTPAAE